MFVSFSGLVRGKAAVPAGAGTLGTAAVFVKRGCPGRESPDPGPLCYNEGLGASVQTLIFNRTPLLRHDVHPLPTDLPRGRRPRRKGRAVGAFSPCAACPALPCRLAARPLRRWLLGCGVWFAAQGPAQAQRLEELYQAARGYDATFLSARALFDSARFRTAQTRGLNAPTVALQLTGGRSLADSPGPPQEDSASKQVAATLSGSQPLFNRVNDLTIAQAEQSEAVSAEDFAVAEQDLIVRVGQAYFDVLAAQDTLATAQGSLTAIAEQVASAKRNFEVGTATITDTREAEARHDLARATLIQAENALVTARIALDTLVGRPNTEPRRLAAPFSVPPLEPATVDAWVARAEAEHPLVRRSRLSLVVARLETDKAKAGHLPTAALTANYGRGFQSSSGTYAATALSETLPYAQRGRSGSSGVAVTVSIPIFSGMQVQNRVRETLVLEDRAADDLEAQRRAVAQATRTAFYAVRSGAAQVAALEAAESSSQLALQATQIGYGVGVRVNLDVLNAQSQLYTTQAQVARARYDLVMSGLRLRQAAGSVTPADVAAIDRLLAP